MQYLLIMLLFLAQSAAAQDSDAQPVGKPGFFKLLYDEHITPSVEQGFDKVGYGILAGGVLATVWARQEDQRFRRDFKGNQVISKDAATFGAIWGSGAPGILIAASQLAVDPANGMAHAESIALTAATHISLVVISRRPRPGHPGELTSFPSGHASSAWATATSLSYAYGWKAAVPSYAAALVVMAARVSDDRHWLSDTVAGATLGLFWGRATSFHHLDKSWKFQPLWSATGFGLEMKHEL